MLRKLSTDKALLINQKRLLTILADDGLSATHFSSLRKSLRLWTARRGASVVSTDGFNAYPDALAYSLGTRADYGQIIKVYAAPEPDEHRYSPSRVVEAIINFVFGNPDPAKICTSHVERQNLNIRMAMRRFTRLTNGFSKMWENLKAALALYFAYYNFCRIHSSIRCTPAMEAGITKTVWTLKDLLIA